MTKTMKPLIGMTMEWDDSKVAKYTLRENYCACVAEAGGVPILLPYDVASVARYGASLSGLIITGGDFDIDPSLFGDKVRHERVRTLPQRTGFELAMAQAMLAQDKPVLGICGGMQLLNVARGGTLIQDIADTIKGALAHEQPNPRTEMGHKIIIEEATLLHRLVDKKEMGVNSAHHQAVARVGTGLRVSAQAEDGVIEAIESTQHRFCLGVQWHPEYRVDGADSLLFAGLLRAAEKA